MSDGTRWLGPNGEPLAGPPTEAAPARVVVTSSTGGIVVTGRLDDGRPVVRRADGSIVGDAQSSPEPTRYSQALRRQAANRTRRVRGLAALPEVAPGSCSQCGGWGVIPPDRERCPRCNGRGEV
jgi:hypothetical protein